MELKLVYERAWSFHNTTGINLEDLIDEAMTAYVEAAKEFDPNFGVKETTFVYKAITNRLISYCREIKKTPYEYFENINEAEEFAFEPNFDRVLNKKPVLNEFQPHIQELIKIVLDNTEVFNDNGKENRAKLKRILRSNGWPHSKIAIAFMQIKALLRKVPVSELFSW